MGKELEVAVRAAKEAGEILKENFPKANPIAFKEGGSWVTEIDKLSERKIISIIKESFPDHSINAEESGLSGGPSKYTWVVDPLDGTTNFATKIPFFSISIALAEDNILKLGVVYDPIHDEIFTTEREKNPRLNDVPITVSKTENFKGSMIGYSRPSHSKKEFIDIFPKVEKRARGPRILGSTALQLCYVASGRFDADISLSQRPWDISAGALIVKEAGGKVTDLSGEDWGLEIGNIVASNGKIHDELLAILNKN